MRLARARRLGSGAGARARRAERRRGRRCRAPGRAGRAARLSCITQLSSARLPVPCRNLPPRGAGSPSSRRRSSSSASTSSSSTSRSRRYGEDFPAASVSGLSWVLSAYAIVYAALLVPFGKLGDLAGRLRVFRAGLARLRRRLRPVRARTGAELLVAARVVQATGAAAITPTSLGLVLPTFPPEKRSAGDRGVGRAGRRRRRDGTAARRAHRRAQLALDLRHQRPGRARVPRVRGRYFAEVRDPSGRLPDGLGAVLARQHQLLALGLAQGPDWGWDARVVARLAASAASARCSCAVPPPSRAGLALDLLRSPSFALAGLATLLFFAGFGGCCSATCSSSPAWGGLGLQAGLGFAPGPVLAAVSAALSGRVADRVGPCAPRSPRRPPLRARHVRAASRCRPTPTTSATTCPARCAPASGSGCASPPSPPRRSSTCPRRRWPPASRP